MLVVTLDLHIQISGHAVAVPITIILNAQGISSAEMLCKVTISRFQIPNFQIAQPLKDVPLPHSSLCSFPQRIATF